MAVKRKVVGMEEWEVELLHTQSGRLEETAKKRRVDDETESPDVGAAPTEKEEDVVFSRCDKVEETEKSIKVEAKVVILKYGAATDLVDEGEASKGCHGEEDLKGESRTYEEERNRILEENRKRMQQLGLRNLTNQLSPAYRTRTHMKSATAANTKKNHIKHQVEIGFQPFRSARVASNQEAKVDILRDDPATDLFDEGEAIKGLSGEEDLEEERRIYEEERNRIQEENRKRMQELGLLDLTNELSPTYKTRTHVKRNYVKHQAEAGFQPRRSARVASRAERSKLPRNKEGQRQGRADRAERRAEKRNSNEKPREETQNCKIRRILPDYMRKFEAQTCLPLQRYASGAEGSKLPTNTEGQVKVKEDLVELKEQEPILLEPATKSTENSQVTSIFNESDVDYHVNRILLQSYYSSYFRVRYFVC